MSDDTIRKMANEIGQTVNRKAERVADTRRKAHAVILQLAKDGHDVKGDAEHAKHGVAGIV